MEPTNKAGEGSRSDTTAGEGRGERGDRGAAVGEKKRGKRVLCVGVALTFTRHAGMNIFFTLLLLYTLQLAVFATCSFYSKQVKEKKNGTFTSLLVLLLQIPVKVKVKVGAKLNS